MKYEEYTPKNIFSGNVMPVVTDTIKLARKEVVRELSVIYHDSNANEFYTSARIKSGTEDEYEILNPNNVYALSTIDTGNNLDEVEIPVYMTGQFYKNEIELPEGENIENYIAPLRKLGIFLK